MARKWKPSKAQRREFAIKMQNPEECEAYETRKKNKAEKRRNDSRFDYENAGGGYVPSREQHDFAIFNRPDCLNSSQETACNQVAYGFSCNEKIEHDYIHLVNELIRASKD